MSVYASINDYGFLVTPFAPVKKGVVQDEVLFLRADEEHDHTIANADVKLDHKTGKILQDRVMARRRSEFVNVPVDEVTLLDVSPKQLVGVAAGLIPFLEHDDANRALMGSNMQRQAVPLIRPDVALVGTGMEPYVARNSGMMLVAEEDGVIEYADGTRIVVRYGSGNSARAGGNAAAQILRAQRTHLLESDPHRQSRRQGQRKARCSPKARPRAPANWRWATTCWWPS